MRMEWSVALGRRRRQAGEHGFFIRNARRPAPDCKNVPVRRVKAAGANTDILHLIHCCLSAGLTASHNKDMSSIRIVMLLIISELFFLILQIMVDSVA